MDGNIEFLGRMDNQVKIRGFRIEIGEIEARLVRHHRIKEAVATVKQTKDGDKFLCAYLVLEQQGSADVDAPSVSEIREFLARDLPGYMIPVAYFEFPSAIQTAGIKLSRKVLQNYLIDENNHLQSIK